MDYSKRRTVSKSRPEIDSLYVYKTNHSAKFTHRHQLGKNYPYTNHNAIINAEEGEIHIYHRTVKIKGIERGLTLVTKNSKVNEVRKFFKEQIGAIEDNDNLFDIFIHSSYTPQQLGIYYTY